VLRVNPRRDAPRNAGRLGNQHECRNQGGEPMVMLLDRESL